MTLRSFALLALPLVLLSDATVGCRNKPELGFRVDLPPGLDGVTWIEVGAFRDASCAALTPMLDGGIPNGSAIRTAFQLDQSAPRLGDLGRGRYAFGAVAKRDNCQVIASGCVEADVTDADAIVVPVAVAPNGGGACDAASVCEAGRCVPANDNASGGVGAGCSLELLGAGPLANTGGAGTLVSAPAIAATDRGFLIAYRETVNGAALVTLLPIDSGGGASDPLRQPLSARCQNSEETDGIGLALMGETGMLGFARPACGATPGLEYVEFSGLSILDDRLSTPDRPDRLAMSHARAAAPRPGGDAVITFTQGGAGLVATMARGRGIVSPSGSFGGVDGVTGTWVATSDRVLALLAARTLTGDAALDDAGLGAGDAGTTRSILRLTIAPIETSLDDFNANGDLPRTPIEFPGGWGSLAARGARVIVVSESDGFGRTVAYRTFDLNGAGAAAASGFSTEGTGRATNADVAIEGDRAFFAVLKPGALSLVAYTNATTSPTQLRQVPFLREPRIPAINTIRDGRVAIATTASRVAVVWTTAKVLGPSDITGGYAVFACTQ